MKSQKSLLTLFQANTGKTTYTPKNLNPAQCWQKPRTDKIKKFMRF